jgi:hypothetical protein
MLPGNPRICLADIQPLTALLEKELWSEDVEKIAPYFWLMSSLMSFHSSANISPLHHQIIKGREIILTEDPSLHLVWLPHRIHIEPLPTYLMSFTFWEQYTFSLNSPLPDERGFASWHQHSDSLSLITTSSTTNPTSS